MFKYHMQRRRHGGYWGWGGTVPSHSTQRLF